MYSVHSYGQMLADTPRLQAYIAALKTTVKPGSVVLDLGCGPGLFSLLACRLGARRVFAVEPDDVIQLAREAAGANDCADRIEFLQNFSTDITLPEPADIIISDLRGVLPWYQKHIPSIIDARRRLLAANGVLIPQVDVLWAAIVEVPERYSEIVDPWEQEVNLSAARRTVTNTWRKARINTEQLLTKPLCWSRINYREIESADFKSELSFSVPRSGTAHGVAVWFDSELTDQISFSNNPAGPELIYGQAFFPFPHPVEVSQGYRIELSLGANLVTDDYVWGWDTSILTPESSQPKVSFKQTTLFGVPLSPAQLRKQSAAYKPTLNESGQVERFILQSMSGDASLEEIAERLRESFPQRYADWKAALNDVTKVSLEFSE